MISSTWVLQQFISPTQRMGYKDFLDKLIEHGIRHVLEALVFVNQGNKLLCRFLSLVVIAP